MLRMIFLLLLIVVSTFISGCQKSVEDKVYELLSLGDKYLLENNYEEAILSFNKILELEPRNIDAYFRISKAYSFSNEDISAVEILNTGFQLTEDKKLYDEMVRLCNEYASNLAENDRVEAIRFLEKWISITESDILSKKKQLLENRYPDSYIGDSDYYVYEEDIQEDLKIIYNIAKDGEVEAVKNFISNEYAGISFPTRCMIYSDFYYGGKEYYGERDGYGRPEGFGVAFCDDGFNTSLYVGEWEDGKRIDGISIQTNNKGVISYYEGVWSNDLPNGYGISYDSGPGMTCIGTYVNGYCHGETIVEWEHSDHIHTYNVNFNMGIGQEIENDYGYSEDSFFIAKISEDNCGIGLGQTRGDYYTAFGFPPVSNISPDEPWAFKIDE